MHEQPPGWRRGVDAFGERAELYAARFHVLDPLQQVEHRAAETVELPDDERITIDRIEQGGTKLRPLRRYAGHLFLVKIVGQHASFEQRVAL